MRELNFRLFQLRGATIRVHVSFLLSALFLAYGAAASVSVGAAAAWTTLAFGLGALLVGVILHEAAHAAVARAFGGEHEVWDIWPLGGLRFPLLSPWDKDDVVLSQEEALVAMAGPAANLAVCLLLLPVLIVLEVPLHLVLNPLRPPLYASGWDGAAALIFWTNWLLVVVNLLPAFPFDAARAVRASLWRTYGGEIAQGGALILSRAVGVVLVVTAVLVQPYASWASLPVVFTALMVFACSADPVRHTEAEEDLFLEDAPWSYGRAPDDADRSSPRTYRRVERDGEDESPYPASNSPEPDRASASHGVGESSFRSTDVVEEEASSESSVADAAVADEERLDQLLARIHAGGLASLTDEERGLMLRISARYRAKQQGARSASSEG